MKTELMSFRNVSLEASPSGKLSYINLNIFRGEAIGIIGLKGSGIIRIIDVCSDVSEMISGEIRLEDSRYKAKSIYEARKNGVFHISFKSNLIKEISVSENFFLTRSKKNPFDLVNNRSINIEMTRVLKEFNMTIDGDTLVSKLTSMQCLFLELIKAYILNAKVIFLHNVIKEYKKSNLDDFKNILRIIRQRGIAVVFLGHNYNSLMGNMDRIYVLSLGSVSRILYKGAYTEADLIAFMIGHQSAESIKLENQVNIIEEKALYALNNLCTNKVKNLTFSVKRGTVLGLLDYDFYCGNELSRALIGELKVEKGEMFIWGKKLKKINTSQVIARGVGLISHTLSSTLFEDLSVKDNVTFSMLDSSHKLKTMVNDRVVDFAFKEMSGFLMGIDGHAIVNSLNHDERVRVQLAKFIFSKASILIVEHPMIDSDIVQGQMIHDFVQQMADKGCAVMIISSNLEYLKKTCDEIIVIKEGVQSADRYNQK